MDQPALPEHAPFRSLASILLPALAAISVLLCLPPLVTHLQSRNVAAAVIVFCITLDNLFNFVNPLIWPTDSLETSGMAQVFAILKPSSVLHPALQFPVL
jgi:pheromone a factor receptor